MSKKVTVYSTAACPYCNMLKDYLKENSIEFESKDVGKDVGKDKVAAKEMIGKSNQMGVPVTDIEGKIIVGFDKEQISKELGL